MKAGTFQTAINTDSTVLFFIENNALQRIKKSH